jgi:hypothetical protein
MEAIEQFKLALAMTESTNNPFAWGDQGLAVGRWQIHPAWFHDWRVDPPAVRDSWDDVFDAALERFWRATVGKGMAPVSAAMEFHLGAAAVAHGKWDADYADRFIERFRDAASAKTEVL